MAHHEPIRRQISGSRGPGDGPAVQPTEIPDKLYFRIGEVARLCDVPAYVLRFWETEFPQLKPNKGGTGQRLFRRRDVEMALRIKRLLYDEGYTIPGARQLLKSESRAREPQLTLLGEDAARMHGLQARMRDLQRELQELREMLAGPATAAAERTARAVSRGTGSHTGRRSQFVAAPVNESLFEFPGAPRGNGMETDD